MTDKIETDGVDGYITCPLCKALVKNDPDFLLVASLKCTPEDFEKYVCTIAELQDTQRQILKAQGIEGEKVETEFQVRRIFQPGSGYRICIIGCPICISSLTNLLGPKFSKISIAKINTYGRTYKFKDSKVLNYEDPNTGRTKPANPGT